LRAECGEEAAQGSDTKEGGVADPMVEERGSAMDAEKPQHPPSPASLLDVAELDEDLDEDLSEDSFGDTYGDLCSVGRGEPRRAGGIVNAVDAVVDGVVDGVLGLASHAYAPPAPLCLDLEFRAGEDDLEGGPAAYDVGTQGLPDDASSLSTDDGPCGGAGADAMPLLGTGDSDTDTDMFVDEAFLMGDDDEGVCPPGSVEHCDDEYKVDSASSTGTVVTEALSESSTDSDLSSDDSSCSFLGSSLCLVDHDDTLLATTAVGEMGLHIDGADGDAEQVEVPAEVAASLAQLDELSEALILEALRHGPVRIVTNAEAGWVELSSARFLPRTAALLRQRNVRVISARTTYEARFPNMPTAWKVAAFADEIARTFPDARDRPDDAKLNVLVFGDSMSERHAAHAVARQLPRTRVKTVKFVERPDVATLQRQLAHVTAVYGDLFVHDGSFDINTVC